MHCLLKNPFDLPFEAWSWIRVAQRGDLEVGSQKTEEIIRERGNPERIAAAKGQVVEVSLSIASFPKLNHIDTVQSLSPGPGI